MHTTIQINSFSEYSPICSYVVSTVIQFSIHKKLCMEAGEYDPIIKPDVLLAECSLFGSDRAGDILRFVAYTPNAGNEMRPICRLHFLGKQCRWAHLLGGRKCFTCSPDLLNWIRRAYWSISSHCMPF